MKAVRYHRPKKVTVDDVPDARVQHARDVVLRVTSTGICGSDLHVYNGMMPQLANMTLGHEFVGIVEHVGAHVTNLEEGERVVVPFPATCGECWYCTSALPTACSRANPHYGPDGRLVSRQGGGIFGHTDLYGGREGGQAEMVRVPYGDNGPCRVPRGLSDEQVLLLGDCLPAAWHGVQWGDVQEGETVAVFGCGPVGILTQRIARMRGARVIGIDRLDDRLDAARRLVGSMTLNVEDEDVVEAIRAETDGRGADVTIDAVGMQEDPTIVGKASAALHLHRSASMVLRLCYESVRRGGRISVLGAYNRPCDGFPLHQLFDKALQMKGGQSTAPAVIHELMAMVERGTLHADDVITHTATLEEAPQMYELFNQRKDGCLKVVLKP